MKIIHFVKFLFILNVFVFDANSHAIESSQWVTIQDWSRGDAHPEFVAESNMIIQECKNHPQSAIQFPIILYGAQQIFLDNKLIFTFGDSSFQTPNIITGAPEVQCDQLISGNTLKWVATSYSPTFARFNHWPQLNHGMQFGKLFSEYQYLFGIIGLYLISIFSFFLMYRKEKPQFIISIVGAAFFISIYFIGSIMPYFTNQFSMLTVNKVSDISLGLGNTFLFFAFYIEKQIGKKLFIFQLCSFLIGAVFNLIGQSGDQVQFGTSLQFLAAVFILTQIIVFHLKQLKSNFKLEVIFKSLSGVGYSIFTIYEIMFFSGITDGPSLLPIGVLFSFFTLYLSVNERINRTYQDLAYLKANLEKEVEIKTAELNRKTNQIIQESEEKYQLAKNFSNIARRAAHDIRSPLTTINYIAKKMSQTNPEDGKSLMMMSKQLIDIANDLLNYQSQARVTKQNEGRSEVSQSQSESNEASNYLNRFFDEGSKSTTEQVSQQYIVAIPNLPKVHSDDLFSLLKEIVETKKIELEHTNDRFESQHMQIVSNNSNQQNNQNPKSSSKDNKTRISVYNDLEQSGFIQFDQSQLMRLISNLLNNANEAIQNHPGMISISLSNHICNNQSCIAIEIRDNGPGFPNEIIKNFGSEKAISIGKDNGHGIGLSSAHKMVQDWNAHIQIANLKPTGAKVAIFFPLIQMDLKEIG